MANTIQPNAAPPRPTPPSAHSRSSSDSHSSAASSSYSSPYSSSSSSYSFPVPSVLFACLYFSIIFSSRAVSSLPCPSLLFSPLRFFSLHTSSRLASRPLHHTPSFSVASHAASTRRHLAIRLYDSHFVFSMSMGDTRPASVTANDNSSSDDSSRSDDSSSSEATWQQHVRLPHLRSRSRSIDRFGHDHLYDDPFICKRTLQRGRPVAMCLDECRRTSRCSLSAIALSFYTYAYRLL